MLGISDYDGLAYNKPKFPPITTINFEWNICLNMTLFRKRVFVDAIKDLSRWGHPEASGCAFNPMTKVLTKYRKGGDRERRPCEDGSRGWSYRLKSACGHKKLEEARKDSALETSEGAWPAENFVSDLWPPELWENTSLLF